MPLYRCLVYGKNFPGALIKSKKPCGFYTTRFVEASDPEDAELKVVDLLREDASLQVSEKHRNSDARVFIDEIEEVAEITGPNKGFTFYSN